ncbi:hypothetical protein [Spirosoma lacussanchae]|uniref:hypothetical protein n=1 Tax=Spirosoma lacussanchae TaxID=1884249 RepID=UPI00148699F8|nr:hypothetical protein [Spirosoma lacussanchae]
MHTGARSRTYGTLSTRQPSPTHHPIRMACPRQTTMPDYKPRRGGMFCPLPGFIINKQE